MVARIQDVPRIRLLKWSGHHEISQSKRVKGPLPWVAIPTRQGIGYCRLVERCGAVGLGVWVALVQLAASRTSENRGIIEGTIDDVAIMARLCSEDVRSVLGVLSDLGWIALEGSSNGRDPSVVDDARSTVDDCRPTDGRTDGRETTENPPNPPEGGREPSASRDRRAVSPMLRRYRRGGSPPDGHSSWDAFFGSLAVSLGCSGEAARDEWLRQQGGAA